MGGQDTGLPLTAHLRELRKRLIISVVAAAIGFAVSYAYSVEIYNILTRPLLPFLPPGQDYLVFTGIVEPFFIYMKVGFLGGIVLASPVILFQIWGFVAPALYAEEKFWFIGIVLSSVALFAAGTVFAYFVVFPFGFKYLLSYASAELRPLLSMGAYFSMVTKLLLAFGVIFQLPMAMLVISRLGVVTAGQFLKWWRYAIVLILIASAILTPTPDVLNQMLMAGPLTLLYGVGVVLALMFGKKKAPQGMPAEDTEDEEDEEDE